MLDDFDFDSAEERERQARADERRAVLWCVVLGIAFGLLIWLAWAGV